MSWPTLYPSRVGVPYSALGAGDDFRRARIYKNVDNFASEPGGYFGTVFGILRELGKKVLASFRMNDAHFTSLDNPNVSEFWKQHAKLALGSAYGYYGGCLNYASDVVRGHFFDRVVEFADLYPEIDGIELDAMRSPFFFPPGKGPEHAPLFTELVRRIKAALAERAKRLKRPDYLLSINVPLTPELALECGLDVAAWDAERLFDCVSVGTYQAYMNHPIERWKKLLVHGTPVYAYIGCSPQTGQYLGLEEYRAAAANAYGSRRRRDLPVQLPVPVRAGRADARRRGRRDDAAAGHAGLRTRGLQPRSARRSTRSAGRSRCAARTSGFCSISATTPAIAITTRTWPAWIAGAAQGPVEGRRSGVTKTTTGTRAITLRFKIENVARSEQFQVSLNGQPIEAGQQQVRYAANGRDTRIHTVKLGPYLEYEAALRPNQLAGARTSWRSRRRG